MDGRYQALIDASHALAPLGRWMSKFNQTRSEDGLSMQQAGTLLHVLAEGSTTPGKLAAAGQASKTSTSNALASLERKGFIERHQQLEDGRSVLIVPTPRAKHVHPGLAAHVMEQLDAAFRDFNVDDLNSFVRLGELVRGPGDSAL